jgi:hypothetical protein
MQMRKPFFRLGLHDVVGLLDGLPAMVLEISIFPQDLRGRAEAWMPHHNDMASDWASEFAKKAHLDVICAHILQVELGKHIGITQKGVQDNLEWSHDPADGCADDHHQFVLNEASVRRPACLRLLLEEGQDTRGQLRGETIVPDSGC